MVSSVPRHPRVPSKEALNDPFLPPKSHPQEVPKEFLGEVFTDPGPSRIMPVSQVRGQRHVAQLPDLLCRPQGEAPGTTG